MSQEAREHPEEYRLKELEHKPAPFPKVTSPNPAATSEQDRESASRLLLEIEKCLFSEDTDHRCTCIEKIMAHVASLRRELAEARRDGERLWQPMETAPRDGTAVLLSIEDSVDAAIFWKEQWLFRGEIPLTGEPDAWMPLPKPQAAARPSKP